MLTNVTVTSFIDTLNIAMMLIKASHKEQLSVICSLWAKGLGANVIHSRGAFMYGDMFYKTINMCLM